MSTNLTAVPNQRKSRVVHFAETAELYTFERHNVARHELAYTKEEYGQMKIAVWEDVRRLGRCPRSSFSKE